MGAYPPEHGKKFWMPGTARQQGTHGNRPEALPLVSMEYQQELPDWHHRENKYWEYDILQSHIKQDKTAYFCDLTLRG